MKGARVTVLDHPEFGYTATRDDGGFDLAVNGGGELTLEFEEAGFMSVQRTAPIPWQDYVDARRRRDDAVRPQGHADRRERRARSRSPQRAVTDEDGARQATLLFQPGTDATMELPNGQTKPLGDLKVRATEYTVGADGDEAMPGELPDTSAYTYAVEFSVDEALEAGATEVRFTKPVTTYVDNFLGFPAGTVVPAGYYDGEKGAWVPAENGVVIKILSEARRPRERRHRRRRRRPTTPALDDAERRKLAAALRRRQGAVARRGHALHALGLQLALRLPRPVRRRPTSRRRLRPYCPECEGAGSIIGVLQPDARRAAGASPAPPFDLHYTTGPRARLQGGLPRLRSR